MRMTALLGDLVGNIVDGDDSVKERDYDKNQQAQGEVVQERVEIDILSQQEDDASNK